MITYEQLNALTDKWRNSIPSVITEEERRLIFLSLVAGKAQLFSNGYCDYKILEEDAKYVMLSSKDII